MGELRCVGERDAGVAESVADIAGAGLVEGGAELVVAIEALFGAEGGGVGGEFGCEFFLLSGGETRRRGAVGFGLPVEAVEERGGVVLALACAAAPAARRRAESGVRRAGRSIQ